jgi:hypothetical protein
LSNRFFPSPAADRCYRLFTRADKWIIGLALFAGLLLWSFSWIGRSRGSEVLIESRGRQYARAYLATPALYEVPGLIGITTIEVKEGTACVLSSPCPEKRCVHSGRIRRRGAMIICVPNQVVVRIAGEERGALDMVTE